MTERRSIVYLVLCYGFPNEARDLFRILYHPADHYIFHCDAKSPPALRGLIRQLAASFPNVHRIEDRLCSWGGYSLVDATFRGIDHALDAIPDWSHLVLLSEQHLPLVAADEIAERLRPEVSRLFVERVRTMVPERRDAIFQRFAYRYRELPGVGCFAVRSADMFAPFPDQLCHGHQWIALAREACARLRGRDAFPDIISRMQASFIADETCIQTLLFGAGLLAGLKVHLFDPTYVAWPELSGRRDLIFKQENFAEARQKNYLFIRKRPPILPDAVQSVVEAFAGLTPAELDARLVRDHAPLPSPGPTTDPGDLVAGFLAGLARRRPDLVVLGPPTGGVRMPLLCIRVRTPRMRPDIMLVVLSEDLRAFKLALVWRRPGPVVEAVVKAGGYPTLALKIHAAGLMGQREILLPASKDQGFVALLHAGDPEPLVKLAAAYLAVADGIQRLDDGGRHVVP